MARLLREVLPAVEGKGGGTHQIAQGGGRRPEKLPHAISMAAAMVSKAVVGIEAETAASADCH
jgi:alanyl-tRNA synthetase